MMKETSYQNILVINFGQIGDVIMSLPAMMAIRERFSSSRISIMIGRSAKGIVDTVDLFDEKIPVDRYGLRDGNTFTSVIEIVRLVRAVRQKKFDLVIDLHSLYETNLLGFMSGAKTRLFARRSNRSLYFLSNFRPTAPDEDSDINYSENYMKVLLPLGIEKDPEFYRVRPPESEICSAQKRLESDGAEGRDLVGIHFGAGHPSRRWSIDNFASLARMIETKTGAKVIVFVGPEEAGLLDQTRKRFGHEAIVYSDLNLPQLAATFSCLKLLIGNDSGPIHLGASVGIPTICILNEGSPKRFFPIGKEVRLVQSAKLKEIPPDKVFQVAQELL